MILDQDYVVPTLTVPGPFTSPNFAGVDVSNNLQVAGSPFNTSAVRIPIDIADKSLSNYTSFCTELGETIALETYNNEFVVQPLEFAARGTSGVAQGILRPAGGVGRVKAGMIRWLFDNFFLGTGTDFTDAQAAPFQLALWELSHDNFAPPEGAQSVVAVASQGTYLTVDDATRTDTQAILDGINALGWTAAQWESYASTTWHPVFLESLAVSPAGPGDAVQDLITAVPLTVLSDYGSDLGDLEDNYPTLIADSGARHTIGSDAAFLGVFRPDSESDGQPATSADGDNVDYVDDEDGIEPLNEWTPDISDAQTIWFRVTIGSPGYLSLYIDTDSGTPSTLTRATLTNVASGPASVTVPAGTANFGDVFFSQAGDYTVGVNLPGDETGATIATRWRITNNANEGGDSATGLASSGEVEDHIFADDQGVPVSLSHFESARLRAADRGALVHGQRARQRRFHALRRGRTRRLAGAAAGAQSVGSDRFRCPAAVRRHRARQGHRTAVSRRYRCQRQGQAPRAVRRGY